MSEEQEEFDFFKAFDDYCKANNITDAEVPMAFAAFLNQETGWDGEMKEVTDGV